MTFKENYDSNFRKVVEGVHMKCNIKVIRTFIEGCKIVRALIQLHMISKTSKNMETDKIS
jgi:hypothetical protein